VGALVAAALGGAGDTAVEVGARLAAASLLALVAGLVLGWSPLVPLSLVLLGATYATQLVADDAALDAKSPLFGAGLFLAAELAYWSLDERDHVQGDPGDAPRRVAVVALLGLGALVACGALLAIADGVNAHGLASDLVGTAAAAAALLLIVLVARRPAP
jgi:hypothetical protein